MFKFEWSALSPDDEKRAQDFLNQSFANIPNKPDVVGDIYVTDLTFGSVPPVVELLDISIIPDDVKEIIIRHNQHSTAGTRVESKDFDVDRVGHPHGHVRGYEEEVETEDDDVQILMKVSYNGDAKFSIHTELVINWPQAGFGRLPISLHVNKCHFDGVAMIIRTKNQVYFAFQNDGTGPLQDISVESVIGDTTKSVLKNARKVEQFIVEQLQKIIQKKLVYPNMIPAKVPR